MKRLFSQWTDMQSTKREKRQLARDLRGAQETLSSMDSRIQEMRTLWRSERTQLENQIAELEERLEVEKSTVRIKELEIQQLLAVCARDRERVKAEQAVLGAQQSPPPVTDDGMVLGFDRRRTNGQGQQ